MRRDHIFIIWYNKRGYECITEYLYSGVVNTHIKQRQELVRVSIAVRARSRKSLRQFIFKYEKDDVVVGVFPKLVIKTKKKKTKQNKNE